MAYMIDRDAPYSGLATLMNMSDKNPNTQLAYIPSNDLNTRYKTMYNPSTGIPQAIGISALHEGGLLSNTNINKDSQSFSDAGLAPDPFKGGPPDWYLSDQDRNPPAPISPIPPANGGPPDWYLSTPRPRPNNGLVVDDFGLRPNDVKGGGKGPDIGGGTGGPMLPKDTGVGFGGFDKDWGMQIKPPSPADRIDDLRSGQRRVRYADGGSISRKADEVASYGRYGDTTLVHMTPSEVGGLASLGELTINPETGLPEAFSLSSLLPMALNVGLGMATGGMSTMGQMALMGAVNFGLGKATGKSTKDALFDGAFAAAGSGLSRAVGIGGSGSSAVKGGGKGGGTASANAGTDAVTGELVGNIGPNIATSGAVNTAPSGSFANPIQAAVGDIPNAGGLVGGSQGGASAYGNAVNNAVAPSSGIMDWISENPLKTAVGVGGLGGVLLSGDEEYPEEEPKEIEKLPQFTLKGADPIDREYTEEGLLDLYTRGAAGDPEREKRFNYFTPYKYIPKELNTGGLVGLDNNQGTSQSSGVANFLQPKQGNNNVITQQGVMDNMFALGAAAGKADEEKGVQLLVSPVDVVAPTGDANRLRLELLGDGKHRYVRDEMPTVEELVEVKPTVKEELSDNAEDQAEGFSDQDKDPGGMTGRGFSQGWDSNPKTDLQIPYFYEAHPARSKDYTEKEVEAMMARGQEVMNLNELANAGKAYDFSFGPTAYDRSLEKENAMTTGVNAAGIDYQTNAVDPTYSGKNEMTLDQIEVALGKAGYDYGGEGGGGGVSEASTSNETGGPDDPSGGGHGFATGGLISMLKKADGGIVSLAEGKRPRPKSKPNSKLINKLTNYLMDKEDFRSETYIPTKDDKPTIGFGHTGKYAKKGAKITKKKAKEILSEDIKIRMPELENKIEDFNSLPLKLQTALAGEYFRGSVGQSPKTIDYINQGKYGEAAKEFLINEEYLNAEDNNRAGIMPRMEALSNELNELQNYLDRSVMQYPRTAKDTSYKGGIEGLEGGKLLEKIKKFIPFSEGGTLEQYYQGQVIGKGDGMSDEILFDVEGRNPDMALLSRDEYVIPADVVSMIGNGSSNAGAEELDGFLKNVRQQSFGTRKQQREMTNPQKGLSALV